MDYLCAAEGDDPVEEGADRPRDAGLTAVVADRGPHRAEQATVGGARLRLHRLDEAVRHGAGGGGARERRRVCGGLAVSATAERDRQAAVGAFLRIWLTVVVLPLPVPSS